MMTREYSSANVRKTIGYLDLVLTTILFFQIFYFQVYPLVPSEEESDSDTPNVPERRHKCVGICQTLEIWPLLTVPPLNAKYGPGTWTYTFMGIFPVLTFLPIMTAICLIDSANPKTDPRQILGYTRLWMNCSIATIIASIIGFCVVLQMYMVGYPVGLPIPTLLYIGFRAGWSVLISKQLSSKEFHAIEEEYAEEMKEAEERGYQEILKLLDLSDSPRKEDPAKAKKVVAQKS